MKTLDSEMPATKSKLEEIHDRFTYEANQVHAVCVGLSAVEIIRMLPGWMKEPKWDRWGLKALNYAYDFISSGMEQRAGILHAIQTTEMIYKPERSQP